MSSVDHHVVGIGARDGEIVVEPAPRPERGNDPAAHVLAEENREAVAVGAVMVEECVRHKKPALVPSKIFDPLARALLLILRVHLLHDLEACLCPGCRGLLIIFCRFFHNTHDYLIWSW